MDSLLNVLTYSSDETAAALLGGILIAFVIIFVVVLIIVATVAMVFGIIGQWKMFTKAKEAGWKSLIPIYNLYTMCKVTGVNPWWILVTFIASLLYTIMNGISGAFPDAWYLVIFVVLFGLLNLAISIYFTIVLSVSTAKSYGKDTGWAVGLYFLRPFFMFALGIGKSKYVGATPMNDPILGKKVEVTGKKGKFCPKCGASIDKNSKFCPECGEKL